MRTPDPNADPEDVFAETRMSFGDHIEVLRTHLIRAIAGFVVGMLISLLFAKVVFGIITHPVERQLMEFYNKRVAKKRPQELRDNNSEALRLNEAKEVPLELQVGEFKALLRRMGFQPAGPGELPDDEWIETRARAKPLEWAIAMHEAERIIGRPPSLSTMNIMEAFMVYFKVVAMTGLVISSPWVFWQMWSFVAAGLYPHEKRYVHLYLPLSLGLFLTGVVLCQVMVIPNAIRGLLWFNEWLDLEPDLRLNEWLTFAILLPLVFGVCFQTPLVMLFLGKIGVFDADGFRKKRRIAWFVMAIFAAIITPVDALSMIMLWVPMCALYELGILMVQYSAPPPEPVPDPAEELIEV